MRIMTSEKPNSANSRSEPVVIGTFSEEIEAELAKSALQDAGIDCMISGNDLGGLAPSLPMSRGVKLLVRAEDAEDAAKVLDNKPEETS